MRRSEYMSDMFVNQIYAGFAATKKKKRTADEYFLAATHICDFAKKDFTDLTKEDAKAYWDFLECHEKADGTKISKRTIKMRFVGLKQLAKYIMAAYPDYMEENPFDGIALPETNESLRLQRIPSLKEIDDLLSACKSDTQMFLIVSMISRMGLTAKEVVNLKKQQILETGENEIAILFLAKDGKTEELRPVPEDIKDMLLGYIDKNGVEEHLFFNQWGKTLTERNLDYLLKKYSELAGTETFFSVKDLRNRAILSMLQTGTDPRTVAQYSGIGMVRVNQFVAEGNVLAECPANLVNYRIINPDN